MRTLLFQQSPYLVGAILFISYLGNSVRYAIPLILLLMYFYRVPSRVCNIPDSHITSPADGTVSQIVKGSKGTTISIFLSLFNVHVQYIPYNGVVVNEQYKKGEFHPAFLLKKSDRNESNTITINTKHGIIKVKQIAGIMARRIVTFFKRVPIKVYKGDIYGMIKLSSRVDITLPRNTEVLVNVGDKVTGCKSTIAKFT
jgi:phosphatidylserine decarboxylase